MTVVKLMFFTWLAILAGMTWVTDNMVAGEISKAVLCIVAFLGGTAGAWITITHALQDE